jgi:F-type H+-transporting ATPase subunit delta
MTEGTLRRESYAAAAEALEAQVPQAEPAALFQLADGLLAIAGLLTREPRLRRVLADAARSAGERAGLLRELLAGKVVAPALELAELLAASRWSAGGELLDATERLGVEALLASAERAGTLADVEDELFRFGQTVEGDPRLAVALGDANAAPARRAELAAGLLRDKADPVTVRLAELAVAGFGGRAFAASLTRLVELVAQRRGRSVAQVTVAVPLTDDEERRLGDRLTELYGREVTLKVTVDPRVVGGVSVQVGDSRYDGTIRRRLNETRNALIGRT